MSTYASILAGSLLDNFSKPVVPLSSKSNLNYLPCVRGAAPHKHFSFVICHNVKLCQQRAQTTTAGAGLLFLVLMCSLGRFLQHRVAAHVATQKNIAHLYWKLPPVSQRATFQCITPAGSLPATSTV